MPGVLRILKKRAECLLGETEKGRVRLVSPGIYDLADRVKKVCESDRSIAIAHDPEDLCKVEVSKGKKGKKAKVEVVDEDEEFVEDNA